MPGRAWLGLDRHSDRGVQGGFNRAIHYTERFAEAEVVASAGSRGDSYDRATAEALNLLFKAECIRNPLMRPKGGWKSVVDVELAVAEHVDWFNHGRLHDGLGQVPPSKFEANHWVNQVVRKSRCNPCTSNRWFQLNEPPRNPGRSTQDSS